MSCEVICCEVPEILSLLVTDIYLNKLMSFLSTSTEVNCYLAGYFEKILEMLFRKMTSQMMTYVNTAGFPLLQAFVSHVSNYSIMQIIQRLMLPHIPFNNDNLIDESNGTLNGTTTTQTPPHTEASCYWSLDQTTCSLLVDTMLTATHTDIPLHISDLLITVLQLSPPETLLVQYLTTNEIVEKLMNCATRFVQPPEDLLGKRCLSVCMRCVLWFVGVCRGNSVKCAVRRSPCASS